MLLLWKRGHGEKSCLKRRMNTCPAYGHICKHCDRTNHFDIMCPSKNNWRSGKYHNKSNDECEGAIFTQLCAVSNKSVQLDHHIHDQLYNKTIKTSTIH